MAFLRYFIFSCNPFLRENVFWENTYLLYIVYILFFIYIIIAINVLLYLDTFDLLAVFFIFLELFHVPINEYADNA